MHDTPRGPYMVKSGRGEGGASPGELWFIRTTSPAGVSANGFINITVHKTPRPVPPVSNVRHDAVI